MFTDRQCAEESNYHIHIFGEIREANSTYVKLHVDICTNFKISDRVRVD